MKKIKFRLWHIEDKKYYEIYNIGFSGRGLKIEYVKERIMGIPDIGTLYELPNPYGDKTDQLPFIIERFTGLHDKNGKEIYEGDIIIITHYSIREIDTPYRNNEYYGVGSKLIITSILPVFDVRDYEDYYRHVDKKFSPNGYYVRPRADSYDLWNFQSFVEVIGNVNEEGIKEVEKNEKQ